MINIIVDKCKGCSLCVKNCPLDAIEMIDKKAKTNSKCVSCGICFRVCPFGAIERTEEQEKNTVKCKNCPVSCAIPTGSTGACKRYTNVNGEIKRNRKLVVEAVTKEPTNTKLPYKPLITATGSGTNYPCCRPAPFIVQDNVNGVDVVTVVTEAPLSYSGVKVKIDTNMHIGEEGANIKRDGKVVGHITTEEYGSKMLSIGGANLLSHGNDGFVVARTIVDLANGRRVTLKVENGSTLEIQQGEAPIIDGLKEKLMRVGCGSATIGMFARFMSDVVDEAIVLDYHVIGLLSEHFAGEEVGMKYSGVVPAGVRSTRGRYFGESGHGWGGTTILNPIDAVKSVDMNTAKPGYKILVTETTGQKASLLEVQEDGSIKEISITEDVINVVKLISDTCEESKVSVICTGGTGGSARAGVTKFPKKLTDAVHDEDIRMTVAGAPVFILPGGGINFMVDVAKMVPESTTWVPTPATVVPIEYTMTRDEFEKLGGHTDHIIGMKELLEKLETEE
ncbi:Pyruvate/2-oxoacid:ferredoxin oxidoreductase delta subunit [Sedimentibacter acidaminivorans]|uniref:Pyruvate/2-oxoacid:ferredoxin oxidoreductase delta subunit n=1 Tax=Sedimentibacter acidaminivorans TaxID=913099 RepID=A0ABS4GDW3_9FIRM|nr:4Fe-4S binding protein [Sedimentibacter acidaminivorans]MBP1925878.1 Pyruvate/2-oxoacid:ferredoxin oxidoreductase delta subunit [Sedimentibacter acidaminivorans]